MYHEQTDREIARRRAMVEAVRRGRSQQQVARDFAVSPGTVNRWVRHAQVQRLDRVDWSDRPRVPYTTQRTEASIEDLVLKVRHQLQVESDLGFHGAEAILQALRSRGVESLPSERTIYRILGRRGAPGPPTSDPPPSAPSGLVPAGGGPPQPGVGQR